MSDQQQSDSAGQPLSEPLTGFGAKGDIMFFVDSEVGMTMDETRVEQLPDGSWKASAKIGSIFGAEVEGELTGKGATEQDARQALLKERRDLNESLWM